MLANILLTLDGSSDPGYSEGDSRWCEWGRKWHVVFLRDLRGVCLQLLQQGTSDWLLYIKLKTNLKRGNSLLSFFVYTLYVISWTTICLNDWVCGCSSLCKAVLYYNYRHQKPKRMLWKSQEKSRLIVPTSLHATRRDFHCAPVTTIPRNQFIGLTAHFSGRSTETV